MPREPKIVSEASFAAHLWAKLATKNAKRGSNFEQIISKNLQNCERGVCFYTSAFSCKIAISILTKALDNLQNNNMLAQNEANMEQSCAKWPPRGSIKGKKNLQNPVRGGCFLISAKCNKIAIKKQKETPKIAPRGHKMADQERQERPTELLLGPSWTLLASSWRPFFEDFEVPETCLNLNRFM